MSVMRIPHPGNDMLVIDSEVLASLYQRLLKGETWKALAKVAGCTDTGLKRCLIRAGYDVEIRRVRRERIGKTRDIAFYRSVNSTAIRMLHAPLL